MKKECYIVYTDSDQYGAEINSCWTSLENAQKRMNKLSKGYPIFHKDKDMIVLKADLVIKIKKLNINEGE